MPREARQPEVDSRVSPSRRRFLGATAGASIAALLPSTGAVAADEGTVTIVHDTHFHGRFRDAEEDELNIARYYTVVEELLDEHGGLFLGNGDDIAPSLLGLEYEGEHMIEALNYMSPDAIGVGNHEYDFGPEVAEDRFEESEFPWVVANLLTDDDEPVPGTERWTTIDAGDLTVGVFGLVSENFHRLTDYPEEWQVLDYVESSQEAVDELRDEGADVVVCASHVSSGVHYTVAEGVDGLDAIVGSHSGVVFEEPDVENGTVISEFGDEFAHVGAITLDDEGDLADWARVDLMPEAWESLPEVEEYDEISTRDLDDVEEDESLAELYEEWQVPLDEELEQPFFESETDLNGTFDNYAIETGFGNLITDAFREVGELADVEVDVGIQNGGGIRGAYYEAGEISGSAVMETLPFPNDIEIVELTGEELVEFLADQQRPHPDEEFGTQPAIQVSGVSYEWWGHTDDSIIDDDWERDGDSAVANVFVGGEPVDPDETYTIATSDYVRESYMGLDEEETELQSGQFMGPFVLEHLEERGEVAPERENRLLRVDEQVDPADVNEEGDEIVLAIDVPESGEGVLSDSFRAVNRTGADVEAQSADVGDDVVSVAFDADDLGSLADEVEDPALRLFGSFDADQDFWEYDFDLPTADGHEELKLRADVDSAAVLEAAGLEADDDADDAPTDDADDAPTDDADEDGLPGFGPLGALAGGAGGAYLYARHGRDGSGESPPDS